MNKNKNKNREFGIFEKRLYLTIQKGNFDEAKELIDKREEDINQKLVEAVKEGNVDKVKECFNKGAKNISLSIQDSVKSTFFLAIERGNKEIVELFFSNSINEKKDYANSGIMRGIDGIFDPPRRVPLTIAMENGHNHIVELLLEKGADPLKEINNEKGRNALEYAISINNIDAVKMFLEKIKLGEKSNYNSSLYWAIKNNNLKATEIIVDERIKNDYNIDYTFWTSFSEGNRSDGEYITPLTYAAIKGNKEIVEMLLSKGAELEFENSYHKRPVISSLINYGCRKEKIEYIIEKGANVNFKYWEEITPIMHAISRGRKDIVELLIEKGANVNEKDYKGETVLQRAIKKGNREIEKLLIENGAKVSFKNILFNWRLIPTYFKQN